jgi:hypothetical protein
MSGNEGNRSFRTDGIPSIFTGLRQLAVGRHPRLRRDLCARWARVTDPQRHLPQMRHLRRDIRV